jgi:multidrug efflux system membrane fusion protein
VFRTSDRIPKPGDHRESPRSAARAWGLHSLALALPLFVLLLAGCSRGDSDTYGGFGHEAVPVTVAAAVQEPVAKELHAIGTVQPYATVSVKAKVGGELTEVHFREGQDVKQGDLLFRIDPRPFQSELDRARANLASDGARLKQARTEEQRWQYMLKEGIGSQERYDQSHADADALRAAVDADQAALRTAQLNLDYCTISSPIDGRTGNLVMNRGNLVKADADSALVVINQVEPIYVSFSVPEKELAEIRAKLSASELGVTAAIPGQDHGAQGVLSFIDNEVDNTTGTIQLKGTFKNQDRLLWPGQFVNVALNLGERADTILIPSQALEVGQNGQYVYVVGADLKVQNRAVVSGDSIDGKTVIERGLKPGERVVTDGQLRLMPGATVKIKPVVGGGQDAAS